MELFLAILWWYYTVLIGALVLTLLFTDRHWSAFDSIRNFEREAFQLALYVYLTIEYWNLI